MKKFPLLLLTMFCGAFAQGKPMPEIDITIPHPRLMLLKGEERQIQEKIENNEFLNRAHCWIIAESEKILTAPSLRYKLTGKRLLSVSREAFKQIYYLSYSYRMTNDERFAHKAVLVMRTVCGFTDWNPSHFLDVAEMTAAVAIGYDWLYGQIDEPTRELVCKSILEKGLHQSLPEKASAPENYKWLKKRNNWNSVCNMGMAFGAIATWEEHPELSARIIGRSVELVNELALKEYLPDGNYPEGYTYWNYGTGFAVMLIDAYEKATGLSFGADNNRGFMRSPEYILQMTTQQMGCFAYSDCTSPLGCSYPMFWFANRLNNPSLLWGEAEKIRYMKANNLEDRMFRVRYLPSLMLWASADCLSARMEAPSKLLYVGQGPTPVALMRSQWGGADEIFAGLKCGSSSTNHAHMDNGSFVMYTGARQWAKDLGIQEYYSLERYGVTLGDRSQNSSRWDAFRLSSHAHNMITFSDHMQLVDSSSRINSYGERPGFRFAISDLTAVNSNAVTLYRRGLAIVNDQYVVVRDEIVNKDHLLPLRWAMVTPANAKIVNDSTMLLTLDGERIYLRIEGQRFKSAIWSTAPRHRYDEPNPGTIMVGFTAQAAPGESLTYTVYLIPERVYSNFHAITQPLADWSKKTQTN